MYETEQGWYNDSKAKGPGRGLGLERGAKCYQLVKVDLFLQNHDTMYRYLTNYV